MTYSLRTAKSTDLEPMMKIGHEGLRPYIEALWGWDQQLQERQFREHFVLEAVSIVQVDGVDVGYLKVDAHEDHLFLDGIYLRAEQRGKGLGTEVIADLIERGRDLGKPIRLQVLRPNPAQSLYRRLGFMVTRESESRVFMQADPHEA